MPLSMNRDVFITCAVTGAGDTVGVSPHVPITPKQIAESAIDAAKAGAAVVHCHVRDPETGAASRRRDLYREVTDRIRSADVDVVLNLTAGMGGDLVFGNVEAPLPVNETGTDMAGATERVAHVAECLPEICTLDCGTMNFNLGDYVMTNTPSMLREMARQMTALGVKPEIEAFDTGHLWFAQQLAAEGLIEDPVLIQLCMGIRWGAPDDLNTFMAMVNNVPAGWTFSAFSIGRNALAYPAAAVLAGGNVRVGLEDNLYIGKGQLAHKCATRGKSRGRRDGHGRPDHGSAGGPREAQAGEALRRPTMSSTSAPTKSLAPISRAACIGGGVIGGGWIARFLLAGVDVRVFDPHPEAERIVGEVIANAERAYGLLTDAPLPPRGRLTFSPSLTDAVAGAEWVQESVPERLDLKRQRARRDRRRMPGGCADRLLDFRPSALGTASGPRPPGAAVRRPPLQSGLSLAPGRDRRRRGDDPGDHRPRPRRS